MNVTSATAKSLGEKLAALDLTDEEGALLTSLMHVEPEVAGFGGEPPTTNLSLNFEEIKVTYSQIVLQPTPDRWKVGGKTGYTEVEWTY